MIEYGHVETAPGPGPGGYKGVGEGGAIGAPPAVVNAVADALAPFGVTITRLPLTPAAIVGLIDAAGQLDTVSAEGGAASEAGAVRVPRAGPAPRRPSTLLAELGDGAKVIAGGQSLVPVLAMRLAVFDHLIDIRRIDGAARHRRARRLRVDRRGHDRGRDRPLRRWSQRRVPLLARATPLIGHFQIRNRGTIGGSLAHADAAAEYPAVALALGRDHRGPVAARHADDPGRRVLHRHLDAPRSSPTSCSPG